MYCLGFNGKDVFKILYRKKLFLREIEIVYKNENRVLV